MPPLWNWETPFLIPWMIEPTKFIVTTIARIFLLSSTMDSQGTFFFFTLYQFMKITRSDWENKTYDQKIEEVLKWIKIPQMTPYYVSKRLYKLGEERESATRIYLDACKILLDD